MQSQRIFSGLTVVLAICTATLFMTGTRVAAQTEQVLYSFDKTSPQRGAFPYAGLIFDSAGNLYGTTFEGGTATGAGCIFLGGCGTVFELMRKVGGGWTEAVLHNFGDGEDGRNPTAGLIFDSAGNLYGTTLAGGGDGDGTVFELVRKAGGGWTEEVLYTFRRDDDGAYPNGVIFDASGNLYGTTGAGAYDYGTAFELSPQAGGGWTETTLHVFSQRDEDGTSPNGGLVSDASGNLYGTTVSGGSASNAGTVFEFTPKAGGGWAYQILYSFAGSRDDGAGPFGSLIFDGAGNLYGTTQGGGLFFAGTVFELSPKEGGGWAEEVLHAFSLADGIRPVAGLTIDAAGNLYGTTLEGGANGYGTAFELTPPVGGHWNETILHNFGEGTDDGQMPRAGMIFDAAGNLYGTTSQGGRSGGGTVFKITP